MEIVKKYFRIFLNIVIPIVGIILVIWLGPKLFRFFLPFIIGYVIAIIANPLVRFLEKRVKLVRKHGSALFIVLALSLIILGGYMALSSLAGQIGSLAEDLPQIIETVRLEVQIIMDKLSEVQAKMPENISRFMSGFTGNIGNYVTALLENVSTPTIQVAGNVAKGIPNAFVQVIITILSAYFFLADREKLGRFAKNIIPDRMYGYIGLMSDKLKRAVGGYFAAQFKIMFVVAIILTVGLMILGVKYAVLLALLIAFLDFLPVFGTGTVLIPWAVFDFLAGQYFSAVGLIIIYIVSQIVRQVIQPKIVGDSLGLNPMLTLFFLYLGFRFRGIAGMILAVPVGLIVIEIYKLGVFDSMFSSIKELIEGINAFRFEKNKDSEEKNE